LGYDGLGRITSTKWQDISSTPVDLFTTNYTYLNNRDDSTYTTNVLASITNGSLGTIGYEYDNNGNIISITQNSQVIAYHYNELNELVRENNEKTNQTITYQYDLGGNILSRKTYPYTTQSDLSGLTYTEHTYAYGDSEWKDLLTSYDGSPITYDNVGNPLTYREATLDWQRGRQLKSYTKNNITSLYEYNHDGIRTAKSVGGVVTNYLVNGTQVLAATTNNNTQYYHYNSNGQLMSINYNGVEYGVVRNGQNDVIALIDGSGDVVVEYSYSSYGEFLSITGSMAATLGEANPFRYRGYWYDNESGFYYLQSRYYDPQVGRFINGDDTAILSMTQGMLLGANLFAYCENNPVNNSDPSGYSARSIIANILLIILTWVALAPLASGPKMLVLSALIVVNAVVIGLAIRDYNQTISHLEKLKTAGELSEDDLNREKNLAKIAYYTTLVSCAISIILSGLGVWFLKSTLVTMGLEYIATMTGLLGWTNALTLLDVVTTMSYKSRLRNYRIRFRSKLT